MTVKREDLVAWERDLRVAVRSRDLDTAHEVANAIEAALIELDRDEQRSKPAINWDCCCPDGGVHDRCPIHKAR